MLNRSNSQDACLADLATRLVSVVLAELAASKNDQAIVAKIVEVCHQHFNNFVLSALEECNFLFRELVNDLSEEVQSVDLILRVSIHTCDNMDYLLEGIFLSKKLEECIVLAKFS